jgi:hypothetical protein
MRRLLLAAALLVPIAGRAQGGDTSLVALDSVIFQVQRALDRYQASLGDGANALPPLKSADFTFKTTVTKSTGFSVSLFIFTIGASKQSDVVNQVEFAYAVPKPLKAAHWRGNASLEDQLYETIVSASRAVASGAGGLGNLALSQFSVTLEFGVQRQANAGASPKIQIVTVGLKAGKDDNSVQSLKLTFAH